MASSIAVSAMAVYMPAGWNSFWWNAISLIIWSGNINRHAANDMTSAVAAILGYVQYRWMRFFSCSVSSCMGPRLSSFFGGDAHTLLSIDEWRVSVVQT